MGCADPGGFADGAGVRNGEVAGVAAVGETGRANALPMSVSGPVQAATITNTRVIASQDLQRFIAEW